MVDPAYSETRICPQPEILENSLFWHYAPDDFELFQLEKMHREFVRAKRKVGWPGRFRLPASEDKVPMLRNSDSCRNRGPAHALFRHGIFTSSLTKDDGEVDHLQRRTSGARVGSEMAGADFRRPMHTGGSSRAHPFRGAAAFARSSMHRITANTACGRLF